MARAGQVEVTCLVPEAAFRIDFDRTWRLIRALLLDPVIGVVDPNTGRTRPDGRGIRYVFVAPALEAAILEAGRRAGEPEPFLEIATRVLHQPSNADPYRRMLHVEVFCSLADRRACGCQDTGGPYRRWRPGLSVRPVGVRLSARRSE